MEKRNNRQTISLICPIFLLLCVSCQETVYHSYQPVDSTGWYNSDTLVYTLDKTIRLQDSLEYRIGIRHENTYKYRDIWLTVNEDTVHLFLTDSTGKWEGSGISELRQITFPFQPTLSETDSLKEFRITHIMQDNPLSKIYDVGISIQKKP